MNLEHPATALLLFAFGYLSGSVPYGLLLTRVFGLGDVRSIGSGNIGATNVLRTGNRGVAFLTLVLDMLKATVPMLAIALVSDVPSVTLPLVAGFGAFVGHLFPVWLRFKGGKGIAAYVGVLLGLALLGHWLLLPAFAIVWLGIAFTVRLSSAAALAAVVVVGALGLFTLPLPAATMIALMGAISWFMHRANISRLVAGTEPRIGAK